ncbi:MAG TPA: amidohydrolase family protein [Candidatus Angelobacter sp.]|jgi:predicted TIM-barrel fold metal-dependent hydrolase|nr:amidohydrolase family protein [Candidatus Angelobacter sp.]
MAYTGQRTVFDADSHILELPDFLDAHVAPAQRDLLWRGLFEARKDTLDSALDYAEKRRTDPATAGEAEERLMKDKGWSAMGAWDPKERSRALDLLGFDAQLVFSTFGTLLYKLAKDVDLYDGTSAFTRAMVDFCAPDRRLMPVANIPLNDPARATVAAKEAIDLGCAAIMVPSTPAGDLSPTHPDLDPFWDLLSEADIPFVLHVGGGGELLNKAFHNNGMPVKDHLGGGENVRSKDYLAIHHSPEIFLGVIILDGLFDRFPKLRGGVIEQGAEWVVSWLHHLDGALRSFKRTEEPLQRLTMKPSEYAKKHLKFTPFPGEPVSWMMGQAGAELFMFSSDYPHPEGTTDPLGKFEAELDGVSEADRNRFYAGNFVDLMGAKVMARLGGDRVASPA